MEAEKLKEAIRGAPLLPGLGAIVRALLAWVDNVESRLAALERGK